jgi:hypothetical protein
MGLEAIWQQFTVACYRVLVWLDYELGSHPFLAAGTLLVIILAWTLYKMEVKAK